MVDAAETFDLRHRVLGRGTVPADLARPDDDDPDSVHAAIRRDGQVVATGTVRRQQSAAHPAERQWQIRGMAVEPDWQGQGLGSAVLAALVGHVAERGGGLLWCHVRIRAIGLYQRAGFTPTGDPVEDPVAGTQILMSLPVPPRP